MLLLNLLLKNASARKAVSLLKPARTSGVDHSVYSSITELLERQASVTPASVAIVYRKKEITYGELNQKANQLAHFLRSRYEVLPDDLIGLMVERSEWMVIAILGILKAGAAYVPIDPEYPQDRVGYMLENAGVKAVVTETSVLRKGGHQGKDCLDLRAEWERISTFSGENPRPVHSSSHLAYVIYTSGSTGKPKGVMIEHGSLLDYTLTFSRYFNLSQKDVIIGQASISFDTAVEEIFPVLSVSGKLVILKEGGRDIESLLAAIEKVKATILSTTPLVLNEINGQSHRASSLRAVISGGEELKPAYVENLLGKTAVYNTYGPTESTVCALYHLVTAAENAAVLGRPIPNRTVYIMDESLREVSPGTVGEICIGGAGLARGYLHREALTEEKFVRNPVAPGQRLYRTGDLGKVLPDGNIQFLGRADDQVKIRGYRIEPGEIENVLLSHPGVAEAVVVPREDTSASRPGDNKMLVAYVSLKPQTHLEAGELLRWATDRLPYYMVPAQVMFLDALPLSPNGKIDRKALPAPLPVTPAPETYQPPRSSTEKLLVQIWQQVLRVEQVGIEDNFFRIGGQSLLAGKVITEIHQIRGQFLPLSAIFANPTVAQLAAVLDESTHGEVWNPVVTVQPGSGKTPLFCIHPVSGDVEYVFKVVPYLPADQPVYGILAKGIDGEEEPFSSIEEAATAYLEQMLTRYPKGPFHLAGYSYGGMVAYEIAQQLRRRGITVEQLFLFDTYPKPEGPTYKDYPLKYVLLGGLNLVISPVKLLDFFRNQYWRSLFGKAKRLLKWASHQMGIYQDKAPQPVVTNLPEPSLREQIRKRLFFILQDAYEKYEYKPYTGKVVFVRATESPTRYLEASDFGWKKKVHGEVAVHDIYGVDHLKMFASEPKVRAIAMVLNKHL